jgi:hypothetical protein
MTPDPDTSCEIAALAKGLLDGTEPYMASVRQLSSLRHSVSEDGRDPDFMIFLAIDSETDHLPPEQARESCTQAWLAKCDQEAKEVEAFYQDDVRSACENLLRRFSA